MFDAAKFTLEQVAFTIRLGSFTKDIYWYGIIIALALLAGILVAMQNAKYRKFNSDIVLDLVLITVPFAIVGARIYYVIFMWDNYVDDVWYHTLRNVVAVWEGGLAIYGGVIGGVVGLLVFSKWRKVSFWNLCDIAAPSLILGQAIGRWGNFVNQEAFGYQVSNSALHFFPFSVYIESTGTYHMATFFYESLWNFIVFAVLFLYLRKKKDAPSGNVFLLYLALYGLGRVFIEGMRTDSLYMPGTSLRVSQVLSAVLIVASVAVLLFRNLKKPAAEGPDTVDMSQIDPKLVLVREEYRHRSRTESGDGEGDEAPVSAQSVEDSGDDMEDQPRQSEQEDEFREQSDDDEQWDEEEVEDEAEPDDEESDYDEDEDEDQAQGGEQDPGEEQHRQGGE